MLYVKVYNPMTERSEGDFFLTLSLCTTEYPETKADYKYTLSIQMKIVIGENTEVNAACATLNGSGKGYFYIKGEYITMDKISEDIKDETYNILQNAITEYETKAKIYLLSKKI